MDGFPVALCDPPDDCDVCMLFGEDTPAWRERVRQAFQAAPDAAGRRGYRSVWARRPSTSYDADLAALLASSTMTMTQIGVRLGCTSAAAAKRVRAARRRGVPIDHVRGG